MARKITNKSWDIDGQKFYETGVKHGVLYLKNKTVTLSGSGESAVTHNYGGGVAWSGLSAVTESPSGADESAVYADNEKYLGLRAKEEFGGTIEAYMYPDEWAECDGSSLIETGKSSNLKLTIGQQERAPFGFSYISQYGNDSEYEDYGYKLHLIYNATASPSERAMQTINDSPEATTFSWEFTTTPVVVDDDHKNTSVLTITVTSDQEDDASLKVLLDCLYGEGNIDPFLPTPAEVIDILAGKITDNKLTVAA